MKALLITVAGLSSRFSESLGRACLKCIYYEDGPHETLLYQMMHQNNEFDCYIIVGGFRYQELTEYVGTYLHDFGERIVLVENKAYEKYGSGYSLYLGIQEAIRCGCDELIFAEGDLYVDRASFTRIYHAERNVITASREPILAKKAVAFYFNEQQHIRYIYDTSHSSLEIKEPFLGIFNSGQIWKFTDKERISDAFSAISESGWQGTNLTFIQKYFEGLTDKDYEIVNFETWINCNTISDYRKIYKRGLGNENT